MWLTMKNLVTYCKHFVSKVSRHSYWHTLLDDHSELFVTQMKRMGNICQVRIAGAKEGYDKTLLMFSFQGERASMITYD